MDFGAHLPLMDFGGNPYTLQHLAEHCHGDHRPECPILDELAR